jgi:hypothetical protein
MKATDGKAAFLFAYANLKGTDFDQLGKIGAQIQAIINNQLLGSGVKPSVIFDQVNPRQLTDYLYSKPGTNYAFRYLEDVYFQDQKEMMTEFETARKTFADKYLADLIAKNPDTPAERLKFDTLDESLYPDDLKLVAKPGSPIHKLNWIEKNKKSVMEELANQSVKDSSLKTVDGPAINEPLGAPNATDPTVFDAKPPTNSAPTTKSAPASGGTKATANRIKKFNLFKHS